jgi:hypothetical protein
VLESDNPPAVLPDGRRLAHAVFISYSSDDTVLANSICAAFEADGIRCWIAPRDVQGGRAYSGQITQAIREARVVFVILSGSANRSKHVLREVERGAHWPKPGIFLVHAPRLLCPLCSQGWRKGDWLIALEK